MRFGRMLLLNAQLQAPRFLCTHCWSMLSKHDREEHLGVLGHNVISLVEITTAEDFLVTAKLFEKYIEIVDPTGVPSAAVLVTPSTLLEKEGANKENIRTQGAVPT